MKLSIIYMYHIKRKYEGSKVHSWQGLFKHNIQDRYPCLHRKNDLPMDNYDRLPGAENNHSTCNIWIQNTCVTLLVITKTQYFAGFHEEHIEDSDVDDDPFDIGKISGSIISVHGFGFTCNYLVI